MFTCETLGAPRSFVATVRRVAKVLILAAFLLCMGTLVMPKMYAYANEDHEDAGSESRQKLSISSADESALQILSEGSAGALEDSVQQNGLRIADERKKALQLASAAGAKVVQYACVEGSSAAVLSDGSLWMWGRNTLGQLGDGTCEDRLTPYKVMEGVSQVAIGDSCTGAVKSDGSLWMWGRNYEGQIGDGTRGYYRDTPCRVMDGVSQVVVGESRTGAVKSDGSLWMWGENTLGQLGDGTKEDRCAPCKVMDGVSQVVVGYNHTGAVKSDGSLWMWGYNKCGQVGDGTKATRLTPCKVMDGVSQVVVGDASSGGDACTGAIKSDGSLWMWGYNYLGQLGDGTGEDRCAPCKVMDGVSHVAISGYHTGAVKSDGSLWMWGSNFDCQIGDGTNGGGATATRRTPCKVMDGVSQVVVGHTNTGAVKSDGSLWMWGVNDCGQLGDGTRGRRNTPYKVMDGVSQVEVCDGSSAGKACTGAVKSDGSLWMWGSNFDCQIGDGTTEDRLTPYKVSFGESGDPVTSKSGYVESYVLTKIAEQTDGGKEKAFSKHNRYYWDDDWLNQPSTVYNSKLAIASINLAWAAYNNKPKNEYKYITETFNDLALEDIDTSSYKDRVSNTDDDYSYTNDLVAYAFGHRKTLDKNGNPVEMVVVSVRGTPGNIEWLANANIANESSGSRLYKGKYHEGFKKAEEELRQSLASYFTRIGLDSSTAKILITGHSRGAAVANLLAGDLLGQNVESALSGFTKDRVYAYTFAAPAVVVPSSAEDVHGSKYNSIFNIVNPEDFVPRLPFKKWGFERFGTTYYLPSKSIEKGKWNQHFNEFKARFSDFGTDPRPYPSGAGELDKLMDTAFSIAPSVKAFYNDKQTCWLPLHPLGIPIIHTMTFWQFFGNLMLFLSDIDYKYVAIALDASTAPSLSPFGRVFLFFVHNGAPWPDPFSTKRFHHAHTMETYLCWLEVLDNAGERPLKYGARGDTGKAVMYCPVNVYVHAPDDTVVSQIVEGVAEDLTNDGTGVAVFYDEATDGKMVWLPKEGGYWIEAVPYEGGKMDVTWSDAGPEGDTSTHVSFNDLPLVEDGAYRVVSLEDASGQGGSEPGDVLAIDEEVAVIGPNGEVAASYATDATDETQLFDVVTTAGKGGSAYGATGVPRGMHVAVCAVPNEGWVFEGWREGGLPVKGAGPTYSMRVESNRNLEAQFKWVGIDLSNAAISVDSAVYTGKALTPKPVVTLDGKTLKADTDYTVSYRNNVNVGTATVTVTGKGDYVGSKSVTFKILKPTTISVSNVANQLYNGAAKLPAPKPVVKSGSTTLKAGTDYTLSYAYNLGLGKGTGAKGAYVGVASVTVTGKGAYSGKVTKSFKVITYADQTKARAIGTKAVEAIEKVKSGTNKVAQASSKTMETIAKPREKTMTVKWKAVSGATNYLVGYKSSNAKTWSYAVSGGKTSHTFTGMKEGNLMEFRVAVYDGKKMARGEWTQINCRFYREMVSLKAATGAGKISLSWGKVSGATGYQALIATKADFSDAKVMTFKGGSTTKATITTFGDKGAKLKSGKTYYVKMRAVKSAKNANGKQNTYIGIQSLKRTCKVK